MNQGMTHLSQPSLRASDYEEMDRIYLKTALWSQRREDGLDALAQKKTWSHSKISQLDIAVANSKHPRQYGRKDSLGAELMDWITPSPSRGSTIVSGRLYGQSKEDAIALISMPSLGAMITSRSKAIAKIVAFEGRNFPMAPLKSPSMQSKPEKDPKDIASVKLAKASHYPACQLCFGKWRLSRSPRPSRLGPIIGLFALTWAVMIGASSIPLMPTSMNTVFSSIASMCLWPLVARPWATLDHCRDFPGYFAGSMQTCPLWGIHPDSWPLPRRTTTPSLWS